MKSNYKKLGQYIQEVDIRNSEDKKENLLGVSTQKIFIESIANTVGTDFKKYKVVKRSQFTYVPDTSRRGDKIGIAMLESHDEAIVSQAYTVFEVCKPEELLPEYLMISSFASCILVLTYCYSYIIIEKVSHKWYIDFPRTITLRRLFLCLRINHGSLKYKQHCGKNLKYSE